MLLKVCMECNHKSLLEERCAKSNHCIWLYTRGRYNMFIGTVIPEVNLHKIYNSFQHQSLTNMHVVVKRMLVINVNWYYKVICALPWYMQFVSIPTFSRMRELGQIKRLNLVALRKWVSTSSRWEGTWSMLKWV